jgi:DNA-binding winged helix-turn-helix (wHTH) protein
MPGPGQRTIVRLGNFEANLRSGELRKHGLKIRVPGQPFKILAALVERPGEVVTREDLRSSLWPSETFVDFEHRLNSAIKKLREALGDSADQPLYIETLPRVGYRFIAPVDGAGPDTAVDALPAPVTNVSAPGTTPERVASHHGRSPATWWKAIPVLAAILILGALAFSYIHRSPALTDKDTIVLADFDNKTGDPVLDDTLRQGLAIELQQSPFISLISDMRIRQTLAMMGQPKDARLTSEIAQQVCERTASAAILEGSIASLGSQYVLGLRAMNCTTGGVLDQEQIQAPRREDILNSLSQIARKFRTKCRTPSVPKTTSCFALVHPHYVAPDTSRTYHSVGLRVETIRPPRAVRQAPRAQRFRSRLVLPWPTPVRVITCSAPRITTA